MQEIDGSEKKNLVTGIRLKKVWNRGTNAKTHLHQRENRVEEGPDGLFVHYKFLCYGSHVSPQKKVEKSFVLVDMVAYPKSLSMTSF